MPSGGNGQFGMWPYGQPWSGLMVGGQNTQNQQSYQPYPTQNQGYNYQVPMPGMQDWGQWMTGGGSGNYTDYLDDQAGALRRWQGQFQMQQPDWSNFWSGWQGFMGGGPGGYQSFTPGAAPGFNQYEIPNAPKIGAPPTPGANTNAAWNWQDFSTGQYQPGAAYSGNEYEPHAGLQDVQGYIDAYAPYAEELRNKGFDQAAHRFGQSGMLMSGPYASALGEVERNVESDYNRLAQEARMMAYENWAQRDLAAQQAGLGRDLAAWQQYGQWGHEGQLSDLERAFQANMARNQLGLQDIMSQRGTAADLYGQQSQNWALQNQLAQNAWATQARLEADQSNLMNQLANSQWAQQGNWGMQNAQMGNDWNMGMANINANMQQSLLPIMMQMFAAGINPFGGQAGGGQGFVDPSAGGRTPGFNPVNANPPASPKWLP